MSFLGPCLWHLLKCDPSTSGSSQIGNDKNSDQNQKDLLLITELSAAESESSASCIIQTVPVQAQPTLQLHCNTNTKTNTMRVQVNSMSQQCTSGAMLMQPINAQDNNIMYNHVPSMFVAHQSSVPSMLSSSFDSASCRRVASFPLPNPHSNTQSMPFNVLASSLKYRSSSESARLHLLTQQQFLNPWAESVSGSEVTGVEALRLQLQTVMQHTPPNTPLLHEHEQHPFARTQPVQVVTATTPENTHQHTFVHQLRSVNAVAAVASVGEQSAPVPVPVTADSAAGKQGTAPLPDTPPSTGCSPPTITVDSKESTNSAHSPSSPVPQLRVVESVTLPRMSSSQSFAEVAAKKKLSFADDHGLNLVQVRVMKESSDTPPKFSTSLLRSILGDAVMDDLLMDNPPVGSWQADFAQPASDYVSFRHTFDKQNVALENVVVRNDSLRMLGTIRVRNLCFNKQVFLRSTTDSWSTYEDVQATHTYGNDLFDTFAFDLKLPVDEELHERIEFCVCFNAVDLGKQFWDSNSSRNFSLSSSAVRERRRLGQSAHWYANDKVDVTSTAPVQDAAVLNTDNWSMFSAARNLSTETPYY